MKLPRRILIQTLLCTLFGASWAPSNAEQDAAVETTAIAASIYNSRLWRIEGADHADDLPISWLFGTVHVEDADVLKLFDPLVGLLDESARLVIEVDTAGLTRRDYDRLMLLGDDQSLEQIIGSTLFQRTLDATTQRGLTRSSLDRYRPFAPILVLASPPRKTGFFLDEKIRRLAVTRGKTVTGLETLDEQMNILGGMTLEDQMSLLSYTIDTKDELENDIQTLIQEYLRGDLGALLEQSRRQMNHPDRALAQRLENRLLNERNRVMVERLLPMLSEQSNFIAIGAAHLPGDSGIIELLRQRGYHVVPRPGGQPSQ